MSNIYCLLVITKREYENSYAEFYKKHNIYTCFGFYANASSMDKNLNYLGFEDVSRMVHCAVLKEEISYKIFTALVEEMGIAAGSGLAILIPVRAISGNTAMKYLTRGQKIKDRDNDKDEIMVKNTKESEHVLVTVVVEKGFSEMVSDALKGMGLNTVTIVKARTFKRNDIKDEFLGMVLADEKEMMHLVVKREEEEKTIKTIMKHAGMDTDAHGVAFSMPIVMSAGL